MRTRTLLVALSALALAVAACGDGEPGGRATGSPVPTETADDEVLARIAEAAQNTVEEGTVRFTLTVKNERGGSDDASAAVAAEGEEDFDAGLRRLVVQGPQGELEMIVNGSTLDLQLPATEEDQWARVELEELVADGDIGFGGPADVPFQDSRRNLDVLRDVTGDVRQVGEADVQGEPATHYDVRIDLDTATAQVEEPDPAAEKMAERTGVQQLDTQVWVSEDDLVRRVAYTVDLDEAAVDDDVEADLQGTVTVTVEYFDFGAAIDIERPEDDAVIDFDEGQLRESLDRSG